MKRFLVALLFAALAPFAAGQGPRVAQLFESSPGASPAAEHGVARARNVAPAFGLLHRAVAALRARPGTPVEAQADFFLDAPVRLRFERTEVLPDGTEALIGGVEGDPHGSVVLVFKQGILSANVVAHRRTFQIRSRGYSVHEVREVDTTQFHEAADDTLAPPENKAYGSPIYAGMMSDDGSTIDVLVLYTATTRAAAGGTAAIESLVNLGITETNAAYANSGVTQRLRLVHKAETAYAEAGNMSTDLTRLRTTADTLIDEAHTLRDTYGADLVSLWVENGGGSCGIAYRMDPVDASFATHGFNVVARSCATGIYSFGHELGHNMGLRHDTYVDAGTTPFTYAHGYVDVTHLFRTIMAYNNACADVAVNCTRIQYFSNPAVSYAGFVTGNASTANAASALNQTAFTVANFRASVPLPGILGFSPSSYTVNETGGSITLTVTRSGGTLGAVSVQYATANATATSGSDYTASSGTLTWNSGDAAAKTFAVPISNDGVNEGNETFTVALSNQTGGASIGTSGATVTIVDSFPDAFPANCAMPAGWTTPGSATAGWSVDTAESSEGSCSLRSNPIGDSAGPGLLTKAQVEFSGTFLAGNITFSRKVSSELGWDCLRFLVDGVQKSVNGTCGSIGGLGASGEDGWAAVSVPVTAGAHTLRWSFERDEIEGGGANAAWIDNVMLPLPGPALASVVSRKTHAGAGSLDVPIDPQALVTGAVSVEPRAAASHSIAFNFGSAISVAGSVAATDVNGLPIGSASSLASGNSVVVSLSAIPVTTRVKLTLNGVNGSATTYSASTGYLVADVDATRIVNSSDIDAVKAQSGLVAGGGNFRHDMNLSGAVTSADILMAKGRSGLAL